MCGLPSVTEGHTHAPPLIHGKSASRLSPAHRRSRTGVCLPSALSERQAARPHAHRARGRHTLKQRGIVPPKTLLHVRVHIRLRGDTRTHAYTGSDRKGRGGEGPPGTEGGREVHTHTHKTEEMKRAQDTKGSYRRGRWNTSLTRTRQRRRRKCER